MFTQWPTSEAAAAENAVGHVGCIGNPGVMSRVCVHCVLLRALRAHSSLRRLTVRVRGLGPAWVPIAGSRVYRSLCRLLGELADRAGDGPVTISVLDPPGKSYVEVLAVPTRTRGASSLVRVAFPRQVTASLLGGFAEQASHPF